MNCLKKIILEKNLYCLWDNGPVIKRRNQTLENKAALMSWSTFSVLT